MPGTLTAPSPRNPPHAPPLRLTSEDELMFAETRPLGLELGGSRLSTRDLPTSLAGLETTDHMCGGVEEILP